MKKIYLAGPYNADTGIQKQKNIDQARDAAAELYRNGWAPFCPHTMTAYFDDDFPDIERETYLETDKAWLRVCDAIFMLIGWQRSDGAKSELRQADIQGIDRYYALKDVPDLTVAKPPEAEEDEVVQNLTAEPLPPVPVIECGDFINHPPHYTQGKMECIRAIEGLGLPFHEAQVLKYLVRWRSKGGVEDLKKARWYLCRLIAQNSFYLEQRRGERTPEETIARHFAELMGGDTDADISGES